jgi:CheY-like chemotaxis protein
MTDIDTNSSPQMPLILIADDDSSIRSLLMLALEEENYRVEEAINGKDCLAKYPRLQPDLVLLDAVMPEMDGFACCQHLRTLPEGQQIPILMITFLDDRASIDQAFQAGATDYITKPIHWSVLRQRVRYLLASAQRLRQGEITQAKLLEQQAWEQFLRSLLRQLSPVTQVDDLLSKVLISIQTFFQVERVVFYPLADQQLVEAVVPGYPSVQEFSLQDLGLESQYGDHYQQGQPIAIADLEQADLPAERLEQLLQLKTLAALFVPILQQQKVVGLLIAYAARQRTWNEVGIERFADVANLLAMALGQ